MNTPDFRHRRLGYAVLNVTDIERSTDFAVNVIGMDAAGVGANGERFFRCTPNHHDVVLCPSKTPAFVRSGWQLETPEDLDRAYAHYQKLGWSPLWLTREEWSRSIMPIVRGKEAPPERDKPRA